MTVGLHFLVKHRWSFFPRSHSKYFPNQQKPRSYSCRPANARYRCRRYIAKTSTCWPITRPKLYAPGPCGQFCTPCRCCRCCCWLRRRTNLV